MATRPLPVELTHRAARSTKPANKNPEDYMKIRLILLCTLSALLWSFAARAQETVDAAKITCNQFMFGRIADSRTISIWLIGYYAGVRNNSVIDVAAVQKSSQDLMKYCMAHSEVAVMDAAKSVFNVNK
jgi:hypothetical protein